MHFKTDGARLAALKLAQMSWLDRRWILSQLPSTHRNEIKNALAELQALNISNKAELLQQLVQRQESIQHSVTTVFQSQLRTLVAAETNLLTKASKLLLERCLDTVTEPIQ